MPQQPQRALSQATAPRDYRNTPFASDSPAPSFSNAKIRYNAGTAEGQVHLHERSFGEEFQPGFSGHPSHFISNPGPTTHRVFNYYSTPVPFYPISTPSTTPAQNGIMSLSYDSSTNGHMAESRYPVMMYEDPQEHDSIQALQNVQVPEQNRYPSPPLAGMTDDPYHTQKFENLAEPGVEDIENLQNLANHEPDAPSPGRSKLQSMGFAKPERRPTKGDNGRYICTFEGCQEEIREFGRKCEWSKHMDKHDRPYKCQHEGCGKLPGFTYSGGLLRHEREVHGKHGGPRKQLNCPHINCKRHSGKGFSRQENLNEHLRRVHTDNVAPDVEGTEDEEDKTVPGQKRKRPTTRGGEPDIREEFKRLKAENEELRRQTEFMQQQIRELQQNQGLVELHRSTMQSMPQVPNAGMPQAHMG
ncbi:hypothetical protein B0O99DRAFT_599110 [Bisporella sp. PMI_857]|nr:hypothetical protein B0O99DRAFT_599110 [Bisporella sp. PMI_857]